MFGLPDSIVFFVPVLMLSDYFLTIVGARLHERAIAQHIEIEHYELNSLWQRDIANRCWFNPRHLLGVLAISLLLILFNAVIASNPFDEDLIWWYWFFLGIVLIIFGAVNGRHICNILICRASLKNPTYHEGRLRIHHEMSLKKSLFSLFALLLPLVLIALVVPHPFVLGGVFGVVEIMVAHWFWIYKYRKLKNKKTAF